MTTVYGIPNCATVKKARQWLSDHNIDHTFHDFKKQGVSETRLQNWVDEAGLDRVLNRRGTTWRKLDDAQRSQAETAHGAIALMSRNPSLIKRPVIEHAQTLLVGFDETRYQEVFTP
jgi:Spx/MgsR family transcriptional regulator